jgi:hypothetical protein
MNHQTCQDAFHNTWANRIRKTTLLFNTSSVSLLHFWRTEHNVSSTLDLGFSYPYKPRTVAFQLYYSFHPADQAPRFTSKGTGDLYKHEIRDTEQNNMYNCSVDYFPMFRKDLDCSGGTECEGGEDEGDHCYACQFTHPADTGRCPFCPGGVDNPRNGKCYSVEEVPNQDTDFNEFLRLATDTCRMKGGRVAFPKNSLDLVSLQLRNHTHHQYCFGNVHYRKDYFSACYQNDPFAPIPFLGMIYGGLSTPNLYRQVWHGVDGSVSHNVYDTNLNFVIPASLVSTTPQHVGRESCAMALEYFLNQLYGTNSPCI